MNHHLALAVIGLLDSDRLDDLFNLSACHITGAQPHCQRHSESHGAKQKTDKRITSTNKASIEVVCAHLSFSSS